MADDVAALLEGLGLEEATDVPALVVWGEEDALASRDDVDARVDALPQGRLVVLPAAGHLSAIETPEAFDDAVATFLAGVE